MQNYPYNDDYMIFNEKTNQYILTAKAVFEYYGIDLESETKGFNNGNIAVEAILKTVSNHVYNFIHEHNTNNAFQDYIIAATEKGRDIIKRAMLEQFVYIRSVGDLSRSTDRYKREMWFDKQAENILFENIEYNGRRYCLLYTGSFN